MAQSFDASLSVSDVEDETSSKVKASKVSSNPLSDDEDSLRVSKEEERPIKAINSIDIDSDDDSTLGIKEDGNDSDVSHEFEKAEKHHKSQVQDSRPRSAGRPESASRSRPTSAASENHKERKEFVPSGSQLRVSSQSYSDSEDDDDSYTDVEDAASPAVKRHYLPADALQWGEPEVAEWLKAVSMGHHVEVFDDNDVNGKALVRLTKEKLLGMGIDEADADQLLADIEKVKRRMKTIVNWTVDDVVAWISAIEGLEKYKTDFVKHEINGKALVNLNEDDLKEDLGMTSVGHRERLLDEIDALQARLSSNKSQKFQVPTAAKGHRTKGVSDEIRLQRLVVKYAGMCAALDKAEQHCSAMKEALDKAQKRYSEALEAVTLEREKIDAFKKEEKVHFEKINDELKKQKKKMSKSLIETSRMIQAMSSRTGAGKLGGLGDVTNVVVKKKDRAKEKEKEENFMKRVQAQMEKQKKKVEEEKKGTKISFDDEMRRFEAGKKYLADNYNIKDIKNREKMRTSLLQLNIDEETWEKLLAIKDDRHFITRLSNVAKQKNFLNTLQAQSASKPKNAGNEETAEEMKARLERKRQKIANLAELLGWTPEDVRDTAKLDGFISAIQQSRVIVHRPEASNSSRRASVDQLSASLDARASREGVTEAMASGEGSIEPVKIKEKRPRSSAGRKKLAHSKFVIYDTLETASEAAQTGSVAMLREDELQKLLRLKGEKKILAVCGAVEAITFQLRLKESEEASNRKRQALTEKIEADLPKPTVRKLSAKAALERLTKSARSRKQRETIGDGASDS